MARPYPDGRLSTLTTYNMRALSISQQKAESISPQEVWQMLWSARLGRQSGLYDGGWSPPKEFPAYFLFETREGGAGIIELLGPTENPPGIKIRYKLLQTKSVKPSILQGHILDPNGEPIPNAPVEIRQVGEPGQSYLRSPNILSDEYGKYFFDEIEWPYRVGAVWYEDLPANKGQLHQFKWLSKIYTGSQTINIAFDKFPKGNSTFSGQLTDQYNQPVKDFTVDLRTTADFEDYSSDYIYTYGYTLNFNAPDGKFVINNVPEGQYQLRVHSQTNFAYVWPLWENVTLAKNSNLIKTFKITKKKAVYGRLLFEDGTPANLDLDSKTRLYIMPLNMPSRAGGGGIGASGSGSTILEQDGYFQLYVTEGNIERFKSGDISLRISLQLPGRNFSINAGDFPGELLSESRETAGVLKIKRPPLDNAKSIEGTIEYDKDIPVKLSNGQPEKTDLISTKSIRFSKANGEFRVEVYVNEYSWPKYQFAIKLEFLDDEGNILHKSEISMPNRFSDDESNISVRNYHVTFGEDNKSEYSRALRFRLTLDYWPDLTLPENNN